MHAEHHRYEHIGWLRAAVLGANDGIVSMSSLLVGVASADTEGRALMVAGVAALVAGAMSMAAGEYVSVSSQADLERADLERERAELAGQPETEASELASIYVGRGLTPELARQVAAQLMQHDALGAHARDELGHTEVAAARPLQAALASALSFAGGAVLPLLAAALTPARFAVPAIALLALVALVVLGALAARAGGAPALKAAVRVGVLGAGAMALSAAVGALFGAAP
jgi:vacuolar iron transporter family protein